MIMSVKHWWNDIDGNTEVVGEKPVLVPVCLP